jgi:hypothetical protein
MLRSSIQNLSGLFHPRLYGISSHLSPPHTIISSLHHNPLPEVGNAVAPPVEIIGPVDSKGSAAPTTVPKPTNSRAPPSESAANSHHGSSQPTRSEYLVSTTVVSSDLDAGQAPENALSRRPGAPGNRGGDGGSGTVSKALDEGVCFSAHGFLSIDQTGEKAYQKTILSSI